MACHLPLLSPVFARGYADVDRHFADEFPREIRMSTIYKVLGERLSRRYEIVDAKRHYSTVVHFRTFGSRLYGDLDTITAAKAAGDMRAFSAMRLLQGAIAWAQKRGVKVPPAHMFVNTADSFVWEAEEIGGSPLPFASYARPRGRPVALFPDITWNMFNPDAKYTGAVNTWDDTVQRFLEEGRRGSWAARRPEAYFKGTDTTRNNLGIRGYLCDTSRANPPFPLIVRTDAWTSFEPLTEMMKYKVLLDLPGHRSWSNRLKYAALTGSPIVRVEMVINNVYPNAYVDEAYEQVSDYVIERGVDYAVVETTWYRCNGSGDGVQAPAPAPLQRDCDARNANELANMRRRLAVEYRAALLPERTNVAARLAEKMRGITLDDVHGYVFHFIAASSRVKWVNDAPPTARRGLQPLANA